MPTEYSRTERVSQQIIRDLSMLIRNSVKDPRVGIVTILEVNVSRDFAHAKVYFDTLMQENAQEAEATLNHAAGFLRRELGRRLRLRSTPALKFIYDDTQVRGNEMSALIDRAIQSDQKN
jgi:ribosome-binding factor A